MSASKQDSAHVAITYAAPQWNRWPILEGNPCRLFETIARFALSLGAGNSGRCMTEDVNSAASGTADELQTSQVERVEAAATKTLGWVG